MASMFEPTDLRTVDPRPTAVKEADEVAVVALVQKRLPDAAHEVLAPLGLSEVLA